MNKDIYKKTKIYKIINKNTNEIINITHTIKPYISQGITEIRKSYMKCVKKNNFYNHYKNIHEIGIDNIDYILIEDFPCNNINELKKCIYSLKEELKN